MLSGFENMLPWLKISCVDYISYALSWVLSGPLAKICLYFDAQIGAITRTAPFQTLLGVGSSQTATWREGSSLWLSGPLVIGETLSLLWATSSEALPSLFRTSWGHSGPPWVHLWVTRWHYSEESTPRGSGSSRRSIKNVCPSPFREINILELLFYLFDLSIWR